MAKEIQPIERAIATPSVNIQPNNAFAVLGEATAELGNLLASKATEQAIYYSGLAGEEDAAKGLAPKTLMPPVTKATAAYNKAVIDTETRALSSKGQELITQAYAQASNPATFTNETPARFDAEVTGIVQGVLDSARPENRVALSQQLNELAGRAKVKMLDDSIAYDNRVTDLNFKRELELASNQLYNAKLSKNEDAIAAAQNYLDVIFTDYGRISEPIRLKLPEIYREIEDKLKILEVVADYVEAYDQGTDTANEFLNNLAHTKPENLSEQEWLTAIGEVLKVDSQNRRLTNQQETLVYNRGAFEIQSDMYPTYQSFFDAYKDQLDTADFYRLSTAWVQHQRSKNNKEDSLYKVEEARKAGPQEVAKLSPNVRNEYYEEKVAQILNGINSNLAEGEVPRQDLTLQEKMELVVAPAGAPISDFNIELEYALKGADPALQLDALNAYRYAWKNQTLFGDVLKGLDSDADQIAQFVLAIGSKSEVQDLELIKAAQQNINDKSDTTRQVRKEKLSSFYRGQNGTAKIDSFYQQTFGVRPGDSQMDAHFGAFQKLFDFYFMGVANGDVNASLKMTQAQLRDWGKSEWGAPNDIMYTPPEKAVAFADMGFWLDNQLAIGLNTVLERNERAQTGIKRPEWMKTLVPQGEVPESELLSKNFLSTSRQAAIGISPYSPAWNFVTDEMLNLEGLNKHHLTAVINGIERPVYIASTQDTRTSYSGEPVYQWYYFDDFGIPQYIEDPDNPLGVAQFTIQPLNRFLPQTFDDLSNEDFDTIAHKYAGAEFDALNPQSDAGFSFSRSGLSPKQVKRQEYIKNNIDRIKQLLMEKNQKQIEFKDSQAITDDDNG